MQKDKSVCVIKEMLDDRKYTDVKECEIDEKKYNYSLQYKDENGDNGFVLWPKETKLGIGDIISFVKDIENKFTSFIIVCDGEITSNAKKTLLVDFKKEYNVQFFFKSKLQQNITKHKRVPKHIKLSNEEKEKVKKHYCVDFNKYPLMLENDPISLYYNFKKGDLILIKRKTHLSYRYVI